MNWGWWGGDRGGGVGEDFLEEVLPFPTILRGFMKGLYSYKTFEELEAGLSESMAVVKQCMSVRSVTSRNLIRYGMFFKSNIFY